MASKRLSHASIKISRACYMRGELNDYEYPDAAIQASLAHLPKF
ncbi:MAG: hypothetical protein ACRCR4_11375 [Thiotrichaceae bacterium]|jgi:hypothetical protein|uniref:Uncharacterized protein n=1 Tax=Candidatus Thiocaldithrix dubininis TaxID=3080823 RepID=A0AA95H7I5_9GAMM|nr:MAG: hypothetical protein QJT80_08240 [Candidatus Thiocaldithrix dubininis]